MTPYWGRKILPVILISMVTAALTAVLISNYRDHEYAGERSNRNLPAVTDSVGDHNSVEDPGKSADRSLPVVTDSIDSILGIPARVSRPNNAFLRPFSPTWAGAIVRYKGQIFSKNAQEIMWIPDIVEGKYLLRWQTTQKGSPGLQGIFQGNELEILDDNLYDFGVGALFVKVRSLSGGVTGYALLETIIGETEVEGEAFRVVKDIKRFRRTTSVDIAGITAFVLKIPDDKSNLSKFTDIFNNPDRYDKELNGGSSGGVHPVFAISSAYLMLLQAFSTGSSTAEREAALKAAMVFVDNYLEPKKVVIDHGVVSWPFAMDWTVNWGIKLSPPWYSAYANSKAAALCSILYHITKKERYKQLAHEAAAYLSRPINEGGSEYDISGFKFPAEYVYPSPPLPNIRVLDGELISVLALYNAARFLGDSDMLRVAYRQMASLAMAMEYYRQKTEICTLLTILKRCRNTISGKFGPLCRSLLLSQKTRGLQMQRKLYCPMFRKNGARPMVAEVF